jgi:hypothetical protein
MKSNSDLKGLAERGSLGFGKILAGTLLIGSQLIRQPGFGFWVGPANSDSLVEPASNQVFGYDLFAVLMYAIGAFLIWRGIPRKKIRG